MRPSTSRIASQTRRLLSLLAAVSLAATVSCSRNETLPSAPKRATPATASASAGRLVSVSRQAVAEARDVKSRLWPRLKRQPGVFGMGISWNEHGTVFIGVSVDKNHVGPVTVPNVIEGIPVRVFSEARPVLFAKPTPPPPIYMGTSTTSSGAPCEDTFYGTVGFVTRAGKNRFFISCAHVWTSIGMNVVDPKPRYPICATPTEIGTVVDRTPLPPGGAVTIDAAIVSVASRLNYTTAMFTGYTPTTSVMEATVGLAVKKTGARTGLTQGAVSMIHYDFTEFGGQWDYLDQIKIDGYAFANNGDSGALVVTDGENNPVGMVVGGDPISLSYTIATPVQRVLDRFGVTMAP